ncbi:hypothetical protein [Sulfuricaulis sp.]|uniref:hypothetical protein n=1 Tax=Sulfuricaulis sp. TaxID=2003553 RepID=UPI00355A1EC2
MNGVPDLRTLTNFGFHCYQAGNLPQAELTARLMIRKWGDPADAHLLLGLISLKVQMHDAAIGHFKKAIRGATNNQQAKTYLGLAKREKDEYQLRVKSQRRIGPSGASDSPGKFLLIKSWGYGLWSDMDHVLGQLLLAEMTGRTPVVHWGSNSLYRNEDCDNAFESFFEPVSNVTIRDIAGQGRTCYPPKWSDQNLFDNDVNKWDGPFSRMSGLYFLNREENIVVSDFHTYVADLVPWIPSGHPLYGLEPQEIYRRFFSSYIKPTSDIYLEIEEFWNRTLRDRNGVAVHVRGSDKIIERPKLHETNITYYSLIDEYLQGHPDAFVFVLTDSVGTLDEFKHRYAGRLVFTDCTRSGSDQGVHHQDHRDKRRTGIEVIRDAYLAARCDRFIGNGYSNVSTSILHMKHWGSSEYHLMGKNMLFEPNFELHKR